MDALDGCVDRRRQKDLEPAATLSCGEAGHFSTKVVGPATMHHEHHSYQHLSLQHSGLDDIDSLDDSDDSSYTDMGGTGCAGAVKGMYTLTLLSATMDHLLD